MPLLKIPKGERTFSLSLSLFHLSTTPSIPSCVNIVSPIKNSFFCKDIVNSGKFLTATIFPDELSGSNAPGFSLSLRKFDKLKVTVGLTPPIRGSVEVIVK